ncbi:SufE family protein [Cecembia lonarensis]|uniref:Cysteine desulfuration protein sufE n=1 Tax=Cecembia lonarensis (strain CCUG 58316 / KCTC 22772 / LW9) TaxID=1225176 RepID=K1KZX3_CECL9|nr:SufE family protein [Cecembia lonarensis]EKB48081.1 Cysteine desulfuration protein sufE [Cecembia lonarensis LW9]
MNSSIKEIQDEIIDEFSILGDDKESTIFYIMELGGKLPEFPEKDRVEENIIKGCQSKVWLTTKEENDQVHFLADSNTDITKGLISLLIRVLSGRKPKEILDADLYFIDKIGMGNIIGSQRSNGLAAMIKQMKLYALAYQTKQNA